MDDGGRARAERSDAEALLEDERAVAYVEYVTLLSLVSVSGAIAIFAVGAPLLTTFGYAQVILSLLFP